MALKLCAMVLCGVIFFLSVAAGTTPVFAEEEALAPGPCLEKRTQIRKAITDAEKHNIGVKPYVEAAAAIEADVKAGKPESEIAPRVDRLKQSLHSQFNSYRALKSGAIRPTHLVGGSYSGSSSGSVGGSGSNRMSQLSESEMESAMVTMVNNERKAMGLTTLSTSGALGSLAKGHSRDMLRRNFFDHVNPDGKDHNGRAEAAGIKDGVYENIANTPCMGRALVTLQRSHKDLMDSPGHRANILNPTHQTIGIGICYDKTYGIRVTQNFSPGSP